MCVRPLTCLVLALCLAGPAAADESGKAKKAGRALAEDLKQAGREIRDSKAGRAAKEAGKEIGKSSAELGRQVGRAAAQGGREVAAVSTEAAREVRRVTVRFWNDLLEGKRRRLAKLEKENRELKEERKRGRTG
jgi:hypothetical protein